MPISHAYLEQCAATTGFMPATLEKVFRLGELAGAIARHPLLGKSLALKGGTAFNLCFGEAPERLSVDLDYNYIAHADREIMLQQRPEIEEAIITLAERLGFRTQQSKDAFAGRKIYVNYSSVLGHDSRVEIDLNYLWRIPLAGIETRALWQPGELDRPVIKTVSLHELCIGKMLALLDRSAARDVWDIMRFPVIAGEVLQSDSFRRLFITFAATLPHPLHTYTYEHLAARLTEQTISEQLLPMLYDNADVTRASLLQNAWNILQPFITLEPRERDYIDKIHQGTINTALLFPDDPETAALTANHPAILWKVANVNQEQIKRTTGKFNSKNRSGE